MSNQDSLTVGKLVAQLHALAADEDCPTALEPLMTESADLIESLFHDVAHWKYWHGVTGGELAQAKERKDELLSLCIEMRNWLRPELVKEPDRSFFWKLQALIDPGLLGRSRY